MRDAEPDLPHPAPPTARGDATSRDVSPSHASPAPRSLALRLAVALLWLLPKSALSRLMGRLAARPLSPRTARFVVRSFGRATGVDFAEVRDPIGSFPSLQAFFTRALAPGVRPVDPAPDAFVSPCDGAWGAAGRIERGTLLQVKGRPYALAELLGDAADAAAFDGGTFATLYLSPRDYHRFHAPCDLRVTRLRHLPGALWPVNRIGVEGIEALFARNERLCAFFEPPGRAEAGDADAGAPARPGAEAAPGREALCIVAVGATMVGKVHVTFDALTTNVPGARPETRSYGATGPRLAKGEEWGRFEFGSTLVLLAAPGVLELDVAPPATPVRLGRRIGRLRGVPPEGATRAPA